MASSPVKQRWYLFGYFTALILCSGCKQEIVPETYRPRTAHEGYLHSLEQANLGATALGSEWIRQAGKVLESPIDITLPFEEEFYWDQRQAEAVGYRFFVRRGIRVEVQIRVLAADSLMLFTDLFRETGDSLSMWQHVASADTLERRLEFEPRRDAHYILRLQPELLRGGRFGVMIREVPSIGFPVSGRNSRAILSFFGDPRDGGQREHHGVDIFAPRHTPVVAPSDGTITRVGEGEIGGRYVWLRDERRSLHLYFAHLETQEVTLGTSVHKGQIIGTVGNTGNARRTSPHLHFGIYRRGPIDPFHFIVETDTLPDRITGDSLLLGETALTTRQLVIKASPHRNSILSDTLEARSMLTVNGRTAGYYRVRFPNGDNGYIGEPFVELLTDTIRFDTIHESTALLDRPSEESATVSEIHPGEEIMVMGFYNDFLFGITREGQSGWIRLL